MRVVLRAARHAARATDAPLLLAVSGGLDSMALLAAMASVARARIASVATFHHGTGLAASRAATHVARVAGALGLPVVMGHAGGDERPHGGREASWRRARHDFLRATARALGARIVTAHTEDDQIETVLMRVMRGSGARGLAGLRAEGGPVRPFVEIRRAVLERYIHGTGHDWVEDPSNASRAFLRNRVRHDLLPALRRVQPRIDDILLRTGRRAGEWRASVERFVDERVSFTLRRDGGLGVASTELAGYDRDSLGVLWSALAGRAGVALDRRGIERLAAFTASGARQGSIPLPAGWCVEARAEGYLLRRDDSCFASPVRLPDDGAVRWGRFRFRVTPAAPAEAGEGWAATFAAVAGDGDRPTVRAWAAGDRLAPAAGQGRRRVKRYLSDAGLHGTDRAGWPVVVAGDDVVWIPGVRRSDAATVRSGGPVRHYVCERIDR